MGGIPYMNAPDTIIASTKDNCNHEWIYQPFMGRFGCWLSPQGVTSYHRVYICKLCGESKITRESVQMQAGKLTTCECGHRWMYTGSAKWITCPVCRKLFKNPDWKSGAKS